MRQPRINKRPAIERFVSNSAKLRVLNLGERNGFMKGVVKDTIHDSGRALAPPTKANFHNARAYKLDKDSCQPPRVSARVSSSTVY